MHLRAWVMLAKEKMHIENKNVLILPIHIKALFILFYFFVLLFVLLVGFLTQTERQTCFHCQFIARKYYAMFSLKCLDSSWLLIVGMTRKQSLTKYSVFSFQSNWNESFISAFTLEYRNFRKWEYIDQKTKEMVSIREIQVDEKKIIRIPNNKFEVLCFLKLWQVLILTLTGLLHRSRWTWTHMIGVLKTNAIIDAVKDWG